MCVLAVRLSQFLLEFFVEGAAGPVKGAGWMRPLTNSNVVLDFRRYRDAPYYEVVTHYLQSRSLRVPEYEEQYASLKRYFASRTLHTYSAFQLEGTMPSTLNTKSLQAVCDNDDGVYKLGRSNYYKFRGEPSRPRSPPATLRRQHRWVSIAR